MNEGEYTVFLKLDGVAQVRARSKDEALDKLSTLRDLETVVQIPGGRVIRLSVDLMTLGDSRVVEPDPED